MQAAKTRAKTLDSISKYRDEFLAMVSLFGQILFKSCPPDLLRTGDMSQLLAVQAITDARLEFKIMHPEVSEKIIEEIIIAAGKRGFDHVTHGTEQLCPELSTEELLRRLGAKDPGTRRDAISALGKKGSQESVPHLVKMLNDEDEFVRVHAAMALGRLGDHSALPDLESARASVSNDVQFHFDEAISQIKGRNLPEDERTPRAEEARRRAERLQGKSKKRARPSADWRRYKSSLHGFEIQFPRSWRVADENKPSGDSTAWLVALGVVGPQYDEGCAAFMVSVLGRGAFGGKWNVQGRDVIPHTATDFIPIARAQNAAGFDHVRHESEDVVTIADSDAAQLVYSYVGGADRIREMSVFVFREDATYQLTFECPAKHFKKNQAAFERIAASFRPQEPSPVTPDQELAELRQQLGPGSNFMSFQEIARVDKEMGEMYIQCPKCRHCERINDTGKMMLKQGNNVFATYTCPGCSHVYDGAQHIRKGECPSS